MIRQEIAILVSDDDQDGAYDANQGVTLPNKTNATYNIALSPIFIVRSGHVTSAVANWYGVNAYLQPSNPKDAKTNYRLRANSSNITPSGNNDSSAGFPLRCLVSTNNRIIINLVSDDEATNQYNANIGITLPSRNGATHNGGISPFFLARSGYGSADDHNIWYRGAQGRIWSRNSAVTKYASAMYLVVSLETILPSSKDRRLDPTPLRCLVSTNNR